MGDDFDNVIVRCVPLPVCVKGVTIPSDDDLTAPTVTKCNEKYCGTN